MRVLYCLLLAVYLEWICSGVLPCRCRGELFGGFCRDRSAEMHELIEGAGNAVEADRLKPDFAHESCVLDRGGSVMRGEAVEEG